MKQAIIKRKEKTYEDNEAISSVLNYIYRLNTNKKLPLYCYGLNTYSNIPRFNSGMVPSTFDELLKILYLRPRNETIISDLSPNLIHLVVGFHDTKITPEDTYLINAIAYTFADEFRVCFSIHNEPYNKNAHIVVCTSNIPHPNKPLTSKLLNEVYYPRIKALAKMYNYKLNFVKDDERYEYN